VLLAMLLLVCWRCYHACFALLLPLVDADAATAAALAAGDRVMSPELLCQNELALQARLLWRQLIATMALLFHPQK